MKDILSRIDRKAQLNRVQTTTMTGENPNDEDGRPGDAIELFPRIEDEVEVRKPNMYRVVLLNDDFTPMEFVVWILQAVFHKAHAEATQIMLTVHHRGKGVCGIFSYDVARTKAAQVHKLAEQNEHPLKCVLEVVESD